MGSNRPIVAVIPARYESKRLPGKPLIDLNGMTMIQRVYLQVVQSRLIDTAIVATDDERIMESVNAIRGHSVMTDPELKSGSDRVAAAVADIEADIVVNVQGDEPLIAPSLIDETIQCLIETPDAGVATPVCEITDLREITDSNCVKVVTDSRGRALYFSRSPVPHVRDAADPAQWLESHTFLKHFGLYVYRRPVLERFIAMEKSPLEKAEKLEQLRLLENDVWIQTLKTVYDSIPVDTAEDADRVRSILKNISKK